MRSFKRRTLNGVRASVPWHPSCPLWCRANSHSTSAIRVERWFNIVPERTSCGSSSAGLLKARGVLQNVPERLNCVPDRATREIVGRRWTRVLCCFQIVWNACGAATCLRSSDGGVEDDWSAVRHLRLYWVECCTFCVFWNDKPASVSWTYNTLMCFSFVLMLSRFVL